MTRVASRGVAFRLVGLVIGCLPLSIASAQAPAELLARSDSLFLAYQADSALVLARRVAAEARLARDGPTLLDALIAEGKILSTIHRPLQADPVLREALRLAEATSDQHLVAHALRFLAYSLETEGRMSESRDCYQRLLEAGLALSNPGHEAFARLGLAYSDLVQGRPAEAIPNYEKAAALFHSNEYLRDSETIALTGLGRCFADLGRLDRQRECLQLVLDRAEEAGDPYQQGNAWNNLGCLEYEVGDPARSIECFRRSIEFFERHGRANDPRGWIAPTLGLANSELFLARVSEATQHLEGALETCRQEGFAAEEAEVLERLAQLRRAAGRNREAIEFERACLALGDAVHAPTRGSVSAELARALASTGRVEEGLRLLEAEVNRRAGTDPAAELAKIESATGDLLALLDRTDEALLHWRRADDLARRFARIEERVAILSRIARAERGAGAAHRSREALEEACALWEVGRGRSRDPEWRERLGEDARTLYSVLAESLAEESRDAPADDRARLVFDRLQRFKARTLQERLRGPSFSAPSSEIPQARVPATLREMQTRVLRDGEVLLDVFLGVDAAYIVAADRNESRLRVMGGSEELLRFTRWISLVTNETTSARGSTDAGLDGPEVALGRTLFEGLDDLVRRSRRILFSPDADWNRLPLGALVIPNSSGVPTPLAATHEIVRLPSATLLAEIRARAGDTFGGEISARSPLLAISGEEATGRAILPGAAREVRSLARRYEHVVAFSDLGGPLFDETEDLHQEELSHARVLHFASHSRVDDERPWRSALLFGPETRLEASRVAGLALEADLAVLSACESAGGRIISGEGVLGLSAGFLSAGVPSVVATLWPVRDRVAERFVDSFYDELSRGATAASALRAAQADLRARSTTRLPYDWAGFVLLGEGDTRVPLTRRPASAGGWLGAFGVGALLVAGSILLVTKLRPRSLLP